MNLDFRSEQALAGARAYAAASPRNHSGAAWPLTTPVRRAATSRGAEDATVAEFLARYASGSGQRLPVRQLSEASQSD